MCVCARPETKSIIVYEKFNKTCIVDMSMIDFVYRLVVVVDMSMIDFVYRADF